MRELFVLGRQPLAIQNGMKELAAGPRHLYSTSAAVAWSLGPNGSTTIVHQIANVRSDVFLLNARIDWSDRTFSDDVHERVVGYRPSHWGTDATHRDIEEELKNRQDAILFVDDADYLLQKGGRYLGCLRQMLDRTHCRMFLISRGPLRQALIEAKNPELLAMQSRIDGLYVEVPPPSVGDVRLFARERIPNVELAADLMAAIAKRPAISVRSLVHELWEIEQAALVGNFTSLNLDTWNKLTGRTDTKITAPSRPKEIAASGPREMRSISA